VKQVNFRVDSVGEYTCRIYVDLTRIGTGTVKPRSVLIQRAKFIFIHTHSCRINKRVVK
jgi:hypothetical protein